MSVMPVFRGRKGMLFLHMENEKKRKKIVRFAYCNRIFMCILCTGSGCVQASQITGKKHTACKQQWEKSTA